MLLQLSQCPCYLERLIVARTWATQILGIGGKSSGLLLLLSALRNYFMAGELMSSDKVYVTDFYLYHM